MVSLSIYTTRGWISRLVQLEGRTSWGSSPRLIAVNGQGAEATGEDDDMVVELASYAL